jgi:hypothetical protein
MTTQLATLVILMAFAGVIGPLSWMARTSG